jgi:hypothetical protein
MNQRLRFSILAIAARTIGWTSACLAEGTLIIHHTVANYAKWRPIFDADKKLQEDAGLTIRHQQTATPRRTDFPVPPGPVLVL